MPHSHRSGALKQSNKKNKRSKTSKRGQKGMSRGRVNAKQADAQRLSVQSKANRRHHQQQRRDQQKAAMLMKRRNMSSLNNQIKPSRVVGIIGLGKEPERLETRLQQCLIRAADRVVVHQHNTAHQTPSTPSSSSSTTTTTTDAGAGATAKYETHKKDGVLTFLTNTHSFVAQYTNKHDDNADVDDDGTSRTSRMMGALDLCRVCDVVLVALDGNEPRSDTADGDNNGIVGMQIGGHGNDDDDNDQQSKSTYKSNSINQNNNNNNNNGNNWDHLISEEGDAVLNAIKIQGLPTPLTILCGSSPASAEAEDDNRTMKSVKSVRRSALKQKQDLHKYVRRFATTEFGDHQDKVMTIEWDDDDDEKEEKKKGETMQVDNGNSNDSNRDQPNTAVTTTVTPQDHLALIRTLCTMRAAPPKWVSEFPRNYILADAVQYNAKAQEFRLQGFVRGNTPLDIHSLLHIPNMGTFPIRAVEAADPPLLPPHRKQQLQEKSKAIMADPSLQPSLDMFAMPDALDGEQNLVGFEDHEFQEADNADDDKQAQPRPAGWSDYQSSWLDAIDEHDVEGDAIDHGELAAELNQKKSSAGDNYQMNEDDDMISPEERKALVEARRKNQQEDLEFPDEVQVDDDQNARDRFARYRALKSFRKSFWDPKENLPDDYGQMYHFQSFRSTQRDIMADQKDFIKAATEANGQFWGESPRAAAAAAAASPNTDTENMRDSDNDEDGDEDLLEGCIPTGSYVAIIVEHVPMKAYERVASGGLISAATLLPHENKASVIHMGLSQSTGCEKTDGLPVKSKDILTFRCGWRSWKARPVFSQNNLNSDKHKFERYLPTGGAFFAASVYGPVTYTPCPVLVFRDGAVAGKRELVAMGSVLSADADRIVVKRIILTGYPVKVNKRMATVKYMFYNPEDVTWFKPAGLTTKHGLHGHIIESLGEHGTMKCLFNAPIKQHDTVCLSLYKRIYPKFANTVSSSGNEEATVRSRVAKDALLVL